MGKKLKRYKQIKPASRMSKNELEVTVKGLAKSLNDYIREGNRYGISENFNNYLEKSGYKIKMKVGKKDPMHLKLTFECGKFKFPGMYWGQGNRLNSDIKIGNSYDILFTMNKNYFNGVSTNQLIIKELY